MFLTNKKRIKFPSKLEIDKNDVEIINDFRQLSVIIDKKLCFKKNVENTKFLVNGKLF